jgi:hypothetical protein
MKNIDIIDVFLDNIPSELIPKLPESENQSCMSLGLTHKESLLSNSHYRQIGYSFL